MTSEQAIANSARADSLGHLGVLAGYEYFLGPDGALYRAPLTNAMAVTGYRAGARFEAPAGLAAWRFAMLAQAETAR